jgi:putative ABC transport system permease protein
MPPRSDDLYSFVLPRFSLQMSDLRHAFRTLSATPIVTIAAVLSLALGIGANTAIFSLINSLVLRALPVAEPARLAIVRLQGESSSWSNPVWEQLRSSEGLFAGALAWDTPRLDLAQGGQSQLVDGLYVSGSFFDVLGVRAAAGRTISREDDQRGGGPAGPVAVISYDFWQRQFGGAPDVLRRSLSIRGVSYAVIGVTPRGFFGPDVGRSFDVAIPLGTEPLVRGADSLLDQSNSRFLTMMIRLKPDQTASAAMSLLAALQPRIREATLSTEFYGNARARYLTRPFVLETASGGQSRLATWISPLFLVFAVVACVLLIACANVANLLLARAAARRHEMSMRAALGASRSRLMRLVLTESVVLAGTGAVLGLLFSQWASRLLVSQLSSQVSRAYLDLSLDWRVFGFAGVVSCACTLLFGVVPALRAMRVNPQESLQGRGASAGRRSPVASSLLIAQVALSLALVVAAGLFGRTFAALNTLPLGFDPDRLLAVNVTAPSIQFSAQQLPQLYQRMSDAVSAVPGVQHVATSTMVPISATSNAMVRLDTDTPSAALRAAHVNAVSPGWFATFGTPIVRGRDIDDGDRSSSPIVALVNEAFVRAYLPGVDPIGHRITSSRKDLLPADIIGVAGDAVYRTLREPPPPTIYYAFAQQPMRSSAYVHVRAVTEFPDALVPAIASAIGSVNPNVALQFRTIDDQIRASLTRERLLAIVTTFFGSLGVLLAGIGLFGVTSYAVTQRRAEISVRLAMGATPDRIMRLVLGRVALLVSMGVAAGAVLTWWLAQFVSATQLYGVTPRDLPTIVFAALLLVAVATLAAWLPARRAARVDPAPLLREA